MANINTKKEKAIKVAISEISPLVIKSEGKYKGFEVELWEDVAKEVGLKYEYLPCKFSEVFDLIEEGKVDMALGGITINEERERIADFSHYILNSGLMILVVNKLATNSFFDIIRSLFKRGYKKLLSFFIIFLTFLLIFSNLIWLAEKGKVFNPVYFPGILESFWWIIVTVSTVGYGDYVPVTLLGRLIGIMVIFLGYTFFAFFIAEISSSITLRKIKSDIEGYGDLMGKRVATQRNTTSIISLKDVGAKIVSLAKISSAYKKLEKGEVDAVVFDAPVILNYVKNEGRRKFSIVGDVFSHQSYGFMFKPGSDTREKVNQGLLKVRELGIYDLLYRKWFGDNISLE